MLRTKMTTLPLILRGYLSFVKFDRDCALIFCQLCKSNALWNILIILGRNLEQDYMTCCV